MDKLVVSDAQVEAARLLIDLNKQDGVESDDALMAIAGARRIDTIGAPNGHSALGRAQSLRVNGHSHDDERDFASRTVEPAEQRARTESDGQ